MGHAAKTMAARWLCERAKLIELRYLENWQIGTKASRSKGVKGAEPLEGPILSPWPSRTVLSHIGPKWPIWQEKVCSSSDMAVEPPNGHMRPKLADIHAIWPVIWPLTRFNGHFWAHVRRTDPPGLYGR